MLLPRIGLTTWLRRSTDPADVALTRITIDQLYVVGVTNAGGLPVLLPAFTDEQAALAITDLDGLILTGGGDVCPAAYGADGTESRDLDRERDQSEIALSHLATQTNLPILGVCRGLQLLNVAFGGTLTQEVQGETEQHPRTAGVPASEQLTWRHHVTLERGSQLEHIYGSRKISVNSLHHQGVGLLADKFVVSGRAADGMIEAFESADGSSDVIAVQWHPEKMLDGGGQLLFENFVQRCRTTKISSSMVTD